MRQPVIGLTTASAPRADNGMLIHGLMPAYTRAVALAGGLPFMIPLDLPDDVLRSMYERLDGVLIPGGCDVNPAAYGAAHGEHTQQPDNARDRTEIALTRWAVDENRPFFGICRGHQVLNVALGGTLIQHIPGEVSTDIQHDLPDGLPWGTLTHTVSVDPNSYLARIIGTMPQVNSLHHQAVGQAAPSLCVTAYAPDGVVEGLEAPDHPFALSVQWHPEHMRDEHVNMHHLFAEFVKAAAEHARA